MGGHRRGAMGKILAVVIVIIGLASAYPILKNQYPLPEDISTHGHLIDDQLNDTMIEAGISFVGAQLVLAYFLWAFSGRKPGSPLKDFPGGAKVLVIFAFVIVGIEVLALGAFGQKAWASVYFTPAKADSLQIQAQAEQFAFYFRYAGPDGKFGMIHPEKIDEGNQNYFGLDPENDVAARDDHQSATDVLQPSARRSEQRGPRVSGRREDVAHDRRRENDRRPGVARRA